MARSAKAAAETLVHYIRLAIGDADIRGDMNAELESIVEDFAAIDRELAYLRERTGELHNRTIGQIRYGGAIG